VHAVAPCLSVCLSQVVVQSKRLNGPSSFSAQMLPSAYSTSCWKEIQVSPNKGNSLWSFVPNSKFSRFLSTHADRQGVDISVTVRNFVCFCTVTDFSAENKASGVKFCTAVHRRPRQGISHFCKLCSPRSPKLDESASVPPPPRRSQRLLFSSRTHDRATCGRRIGMCGYASVPKFCYFSRFLSGGM